MSDPKNTQFHESSMYTTRNHAPKKTFGIGTWGLIIQLTVWIGVGVYTLNYLNGGGIQTIGGEPVNYTVKFAVLSFMLLSSFFVGFFLSYKHKNKHIGARLAVNIFFSLLGVFLATALYFGIIIIVPLIFG